MRSSSLRRAASICRPGVRRDDVGARPLLPHQAISGCSTKYRPHSAELPATLASPTTKAWEEIMTNLTDSPDHQIGTGSTGLDRRMLLRGGAALAASAVAVQAASAATVTPFGQTGAPTTANPPLPLGPLSGARYPDARLESLKKKGLSFGPTGFPAFAGTM